MLDLTNCPVCGEPITQASDRCLTCHADIGAPNVRDATSAAELEALRVRYADAVGRADSRGAQATRLGFENALKGSGAVVNCNLPFLKDFVTQSKILYATYHQAVQAELRKPASAEHDQERRVVDAILFRSYAPSIRFAALSLDARGLVSYGAYAMRLRDVAVAHRTSLLEENSFHFVDHHSLSAKTRIPAGYRSDWSGRDSLAIAKLGDFIDVGPQKGGYSKLLLSSDGIFENDRFLEVHIFGPFDFSAVECVSGPIPKSAAERAIWSAVKETVTKSGKRIEEHS